MIRAIIFDLGGVLFTNGTKRLAMYIVETYHKDFDEVYQFLNYSDAGNAYREGKITRDDFWQAFETTFDIQDNREAIEQKWFDVYELVEETKAIIVELSKSHAVYFLSDNVKERVEKAEERYHFKKLFTTGIFSHDVGVRKPYKKIYELMLQKAEVTGEEALFIDDKQINLPPAEELGMKTLLYTNPSQLRKDLQALSLL